MDSAFHYTSKAYEMSPNDINVLLGIMALYNNVGLYDEAIAITKRILQSDPLNILTRRALALSLRRSGYSLLSMKTEALSEANSWSNGYIANFSYVSLQNNLYLEFIREEPVFKKILAEAKKVHEERLEKYGHLFDE